MSRYVFKLPDLGEGTVAAEIVGWRVKPGDVVADEDVIVEVMTDKAAVELPAPVAGRVVSTTGSPGDMVPVGGELIVFETDVGAGSAEISAGKPPAGVSAGSAPSVARATEAAGSAWAAAEVEPAKARAAGGGPGAAQQSAAALQSAATSQSAAAQRSAAIPQSAATSQSGAAQQPASGQHAATGKRSTLVGQPAAARDSAANPEPAAAWEAAGDREPAPVSPGARTGHSARGNGAANGQTQAGRGERPGRVVTSPAIRRRAHEAGVDLTQLSGSGPHGRILRQDFEAFVSSRSGPRLVRPRPSDPAPGGAAGPPTEEIKVIGLRRLIAQRMSDSKRNIPHFAYVEELDMTELESLRSHLNSKLGPGQPSLTYLPFLVTALVGVLREFPQCNAQYDSERNVIIRYRAVHVGVATQTPDGLKVPVVRNAQSLSLWDLAAELRRVTEAARTNKAAREELTGSTITVTSLGKLGGIASTPIINAPEVAIIGINRAVDRPMVHDGAITIRRMMNVSSSFDHRFVDGYDAAAMIQALKERIEHPATIFI